MVFWWIAQARRAASRAGQLFAAVLALLASAGPAAGQTPGSIAIGWDPHPQPAAAGYMVYVGTQSGVYTGSFDAGLQTTFTYHPPVAGIRYYFSVAAYSSTRAVGTRSAEVSAFAEALPQHAAAAAAGPLASGRGSDVGPEERADRSDDTDAPAAQPLCGGGHCYRRRLRVDGLHRLTAFAAVPDGRLIVVEDGQLIRVVSASGDIAAPVLRASAGSRFTGIAVDPRFEKTGFVFVSTAQTDADGHRRLQIFRFRVADRAWGAGAAVTTALPLGATRDAPFAVDEKGRIFVAVPAEGPSRRDAYAGRIVWFHEDGSLPAGSRAGSPVLAYSYPAPVALSVAGDDVWMADGDMRAVPAIARLAAQAVASEPWPLVARHVAWTLPGHADGSPAVLAMAIVPPDPPLAIPARVAVLDTGGRVFVVPTTVTAVDAHAALPWDASARPVAVAPGARGEVYIAAELPDGRVTIEELVALPTRGDQR